MRNFDPDLLQTLVAFAEAGTLARAAEAVGRTPSAVTAQMRRLEALAGVPLLEAAGRNRVLTHAGERLVGHARLILEANKEAWLSVSGAVADGLVRLGMTQDFTDNELPLILNQFARAHPRVRIDLRVGRSVELAEELSSRRIDILLAIRRTVEQDEVAVMREQMQWLCAEDGLVRPSNDELPVALLDPPCSFRDAALRALDGGGKPYRIAATSPSLCGISAAVRAGIAVTVRTSRWISKGIALAPDTLALPPLPKAEFSVRIREDAQEPARRLAVVLATGLRFNGTRGTHLAQSVP